MSDALECTIVGGGLGGLSAALALGQNGHKVTLLERAPKIEPIGYGIQIGPNVMPVFRRLGIEPAIRAKAHVPTGLRMMDAHTGGELVNIPLCDVEGARPDDPYICIHRSDLHQALLDACAQMENIELRKGVTVTGYATNGPRAVARTETQGDIESDLLIGADGIHSRLRGQMHPGSTLHPMNYVAHRTILPYDQVPPALMRDEVHMWTGDGWHVIHYPLGEHIGMNFVNVIAIEPGSTPTPDELKARLLKLCDGGSAEARAVLDLMDFSQNWPLADLTPVRHWSDGPTLLVGDAAHGTMQSLAQGAGMAIEDSIVLADCLSDAKNDVLAAFAAFERQRFLRTARVQLESRALWTWYHVGGTEADVRDAQNREKSTADYYKCLSWLWTPIDNTNRTALERA
ncbi:MAG: FAD-dependent monooxygenase [Pseudomonadota bacterium]|nr:FAD-dependent monooxygenase [Pseudomonadota bacterium]